MKGKQSQTTVLYCRIPPPILSEFSIKTFFHTTKNEIVNFTKEALEDKSLSVVTFCVEIQSDSQGGSQES